MYIAGNNSEWINLEIMVTNANKMLLLLLLLMFVSNAIRKSGINFQKKGTIANCCVNKPISASRSFGSYSSFLG